MSRHRPDDPLLMRRCLKAPAVVRQLCVRPGRCGLPLSAGALTEIGGAEPGTKGRSMNHPKMLPDSPSPRAALALSDLQPQTGASTFAVGTGSGNWLRPSLVILVITLLSSSTSVRGDVNLPECHDIPKVLCCTERVLDKCLTGCIDYVTEKCPHKLKKFDTIEETKMVSDNKVEVSQTHRAPRPSNVALPKTTSRPSRNGGEVWVEKSNRRRAPVVELLNDMELCMLPKSHVSGGDRKLLNQEYPITEVPANCHSLCTYEHREHVAAETMIAAVQQDGCDLKYLSPILYCANQNRDNRKCCEFLGLSNADLGVGDRCLRMCDIAPSGERVGSVEKSDLVCLSNWNVIMYCARSGLRTFN
nr:unnamed protein product [Haemonchus contortus]